MNVSIFGSGQDSDWPSSAPGFRMRRNRVLPGPLKALPRRRRGSLATSFTLFAGAIVATGVVVAAISDHGPPASDASRPVTQATRPGGTETAGAASTVVPDLTPRKVATREPAPSVAPPAASSPATVETVTTGSRHDETVPVRKLAAARPVPAENPSSPFRLDLLPVLDEDGTAFEPDYGGLDAAPAPPPVRTAARAPARRAPAHRDPSAEAIRLPQP